MMKIESECEKEIENEKIRNHRSDGRRNRNVKK